MSRSGNGISVLACRGCAKTSRGSATEGEIDLLLDREIYSSTTLIVANALEEKTTSSSADWTLDVVCRRSILSILATPPQDLRLFNHRRPLNGRHLHARKRSSRISRCDPLQAKGCWLSNCRLSTRHTSQRHQILRATPPFRSYHPSVGNHTVPYAAQSCRCQGPSLGSWARLDITPSCRRNHEIIQHRLNNGTWRKECGRRWDLGILKKRWTVRNWLSNTPDVDLELNLILWIYTVRRTLACQTFSQWRSPLEAIVWSLKRCRTPHNLKSKGSKLNY